MKLIKSVLTLSIFISLSACSSDDVPINSISQEIVMNNPLCNPDKSEWKDKGHFYIWSCHKDSEELFNILKEKKQELGDTNTPYLNVDSNVQEVWFSKDDYEPSMIYEYTYFSDGNIFRDKLSDQDMYEVLEDLETNPFIKDDYDNLIQNLENANPDSSLVDTLSGAFMLIYSKALAKY